MDLNITNIIKEGNKMGIGTVSLAVAIGKVVIVGGVSILCNTLISIHHHHKLDKKSVSSSKSEGGKRYARKTPSERMQDIRDLQEAE